MYLINLTVRVPLVCTTAKMYTTRLIQMEISRIIRKASALINDAREYTNLTRSFISKGNERVFDTVLLNSDDNQAFEQKAKMLYQYLRDCQEFQNRIEEGYLEQFQGTSTVSASGQLEAYIFAHRMLNCASCAFQHSILLLQNYMHEVLQTAFNAELVATCSASFTILDKIIDHSLADIGTEYNNLLHIKNVILSR